MNETLTGNEWTNGTITPNDTTVYETNRIVGLLVTASGNLTLQDPQGNEITLSSVASNTFLPLKPKKIKASTTAGIVVLYK